ncbi:contact-dependent growth inhibition system immunity protein [Shimazuella kribbensis]|uniref:contact-dependent growth inhibition system immunity protein n=1 Tax=Shimazuella kribbensis TaxID=139808 RepID=UPI0004166665|nr:contact-dependent growth inhibition system immunity protein [Shimazuella kribbensis]
MKFDITIAEIERIKGYKEVKTDQETSKYPLPLWYESIRRKTLAQLSILDLTRCMRQSIFLDYIGWEVLRRLQDDLFLGYMIEGELLIQLIHLKDYWEKNGLVREEIVRLIDKIWKRDLLQEGLYAHQISEFDYEDIKHALYVLVKELGLSQQYLKAFEYTTGE